MGDVLANRGPDASATWINDSATCGFVHRRLAIIDLSHAADQPMRSICGQYTIAFNGEIYNYRELRAELIARGVQPRTNSDTEVILEMFVLYGEQMLNRLRGMYAFAIWQHDSQTLFLARDPYGIKPLYYADDGRRFSFASQVRALVNRESIDKRLSPAGYAGFCLWGSVPGPHTLFRGIHNLPGGHWLRVKRGQGAPAPVRFCSLAAQYDRDNDQPSMGFQDAVRDSVRQHLVADVEVGCFLSGGIDSSALLGLMRDCGQERVRTFTLSFEEFQGTPKDETASAAMVADHYQTDHHVELITRSDFESCKASIIAAMDQPSIDGVNTWFVSRAVARAGLKVAISGVGGDELVCGYSTFDTAPAMVNLWRRLGKIPGLQSVVATVTPPLLGQILRSRPKAAHIFAHSRSLASAYLLQRSVAAPAQLLASDSSGIIAEGLAMLGSEQSLVDMADGQDLSTLQEVALLESSQYMGNQLLRDTDWASMAHSIEVRTPLVDIQLLRAVSGLQPGFGNGRGKMLLANAPLSPVPDAIINRAKVGFSIPVDQWAPNRANDKIGAQLGGWSDRVLNDYAQSTGLDLPAA
jgi:asparagine synthase (glutamine-hydrolysing)